MYFTERSGIACNILIIVSFDVLLLCETECKVLYYLLKLRKKIKKSVTFSLNSVSFLAMSDWRKEIRTALCMSRSFSAEVRMPPACSSVYPMITFIIHYWKNSAAFIASILMGKGKTKNALQFSPKTRVRSML